MAKGKPVSKVSKGANGRKNHGPKRHLDHDVFPKATRMAIAKTGVLNKYSSFDDFCISMQARGVRADYKLLWARFCTIPCTDRAAQREFFANVKQIAQDEMKKLKKTGDAVKKVANAVR